MESAAWQLNVTQSDGGRGRKGQSEMACLGADGLPPGIPRRLVLIGFVSIERQLGEDACAASVFGTPNHFGEGDPDDFRLAIGETDRDPQKMAVAVAGLPPLAACLESRRSSRPSTLKSDRVWPRTVPLLIETVE